MRDDLLIRAMQDPALSLRARGLLALLVTLDHVPSADEIWRSGMVVEGRDAVRKVMAELREAGYVVTDKVRDPADGHWYTFQALAPRRLEIQAEPDSPTPGNSGVMSLVTSTRTSTKTPTPNGVGVRAERATSENETYVGYDFFDKTSGGEDGLTKVGALDKPEADRRSKYTAAGAKSKFVSQPKPSRHDKPRERWNSRDLTGHFTAAVREHAPGLIGQMSGFGPAIGGLMKSSGATAQEIAAAIDIFFADPRNLDGVGSGKPIWVRFLGTLPSIQAQARREAGVERDALDDLEAQAEAIHARTAQKRRY